jgi:hypothetical protein
MRDDFRKALQDIRVLDLDGTASPFGLRATSILVLKLNDGSFLFLAVRLA